MTGSDLKKVWRPYDLVMLDDDEGLVHLVYQKRGETELRICRPKMLDYTAHTKEEGTAVWLEPLKNCGSVAAFKETVEAMGKQPCGHCLLYTANL